MPTDEARLTVEIAAPFERVLATVRDVESQVIWVPEILEAEVLEEYEDDGLPATAAFRAKAPVGSDEYTLEYEHADDGLSWTLVKGKLQTAQEGRYVISAHDDDRTQVTFSLRITHHLPLPGFLRRRVIEELVSNTANGLKNHLEKTA